jgi:hypothetical protein
MVMLVKSRVKGWHVIPWHKRQLLFDVVALRLECSPGTMGTVLYRVRPLLTSLRSVRPNSRLWDVVIRDDAATLALTSQGLS